MFLNWNLIRKLKRKYTFMHIVDRKYYLSTYKDVADAGVDAVEHFFQTGWKEGRNPSAQFHTIFYSFTCISENSFSYNPIFHYLSKPTDTPTDTWPSNTQLWTRLQKNFIRNAFDEDFYKRTYLEGLGNIDPIDHYLSAGWKSGCNPNQFFITNKYLEENCHILASDVNPFFHALYLRPKLTNIAHSSTSPETETHNSLRQIEIKTIAPYFDAAYYVSQYRDIDEAGINPLLHFVDYGWKEGRNPSENFDLNFYAQTYKNEILNNLNPFYYFIKYGKDKNHNPTPFVHGRWLSPKAPTVSEWCHVKPANSRNDVQISVIMPVYKGFDDTLAAIYSVLKNPQRVKFNLIVINDCSPDPRLTNELRKLASNDLFIYQENKTNIGFIKSVNQGITASENADVVLLNSDTLVFSDWLDRIFLHAQKDKNIATITPFSNNASLCSYPVIQRGSLNALECSLEDLDKFASLCNRGIAVDIPTGVGFCMFIRRSVINSIGVFDTDFGIGYGEENDFCMRALKSGYRNLFAQDVFVFHSGRVSFADIFEKEASQGLKLLYKKHPDYEKRIMRFFQADGGFLGRLRLDLFRLAQNIGEKSALMFVQSGSGGTLKNVHDIADKLEQEGIKTLLISLDGKTAKITTYNIKTSCFTPTLDKYHINDDSELLFSFVRWLNPAIVHIHSLASFEWQMTRSFIENLSEFQERLILTVHDYDALCHRHHMVDRFGRSCETIDIEKCRQCVKESPNSINRCDPTERISVFARLFSLARMVITPSADVSYRLKEFFPNTAFSIKPHEDYLPEMITQFRQPSSGILKIAVIGAIGVHKGSDLIYSLALDAKQRSLPIKYHIIGYSDDPQGFRNVGVDETGAYSDHKQCLDLLKTVEPAFCFYPSICSETYNYTLSYALAAGIPAISFNIGAQAERILAAKCGRVLGFHFVNDPSALNDYFLSLDIEEEWNRRRIVSGKNYSNVLKEYYNSPIIRSGTSS